MEAATSSSLQVSSEACGTCVTLQFRRDTLVDGLSPAKLTVYPSLASPEAKEAYKQFFHVNSLNSSIAAEEETAAWKKPNAGKLQKLFFFYIFFSFDLVFLFGLVPDFSADNNGVLAADPMPKICPCSFICGSTTMTPAATEAETTTTLTSSLASVSSPRSSSVELGDGGGGDGLSSTLQATTTSDSIIIATTQSTTTPEEGEKLKLKKEMLYLGLRSCQSREAA